MARRSPKGLYTSFNAKSMVCSYCITHRGAPCSCLNRIHRAWIVTAHPHLAGAASVGTGFGPPQFFDMDF